MVNDQDWRNKLWAAVAAGKGLAGAAVYDDIEAAVEARMDQVRENAEHQGKEYGYWMGSAPY
jgi:hypothetical protein